MAEIIITLMLLIIAVIHIIPITGFAGATRLESLYGVSVSDSNMEILMRHRAVVFGILGVFFAYAAFVPSLQPLALLAAFVSLASFFYLAWSVGGYNDALKRVVVADIIATACWVVAVSLYYLRARA